MKIYFLATLFLVALSTGMYSQTAQNWRGPDRQGIYPATGLLQEWPEGGPEMLWSFEQLGTGFSSPVIANGKIYITGTENEIGYLYILSLKGEFEKKFPFGPEYHGEGFPGSRSSPAVAGNMVYVVSSMGVLSCMNPENGQVIWQLDLFNDFDGKNIHWGLTENLLIDGDRIYCAPGGEEFNIVALNRHNGEVIWASRAAGGQSAYCSPLLINHNGRRMLITHMEKHIVALDEATGNLIWSHPHELRPFVYPNTPIYHQGGLFAFSGYGMGAVKLQISPDGSSVTEEWRNSDLDNQIGGAVLIDGYIYGSGHRNRFWFCIDWQTGETKYQSRAIDKGTVIFADGRLYCYTERGELALVNPSPEEFKITGQTMITLGSEQHWAHLVINERILYLRHGNALMAYKISG
jgi:outer membrane protein assembly factor BamB